MLALPRLCLNAFHFLKSSLPPRNVEEAFINVCIIKHLDPEHELSEDETIKDMLEYNNDNHNGITPPLFKNNPDFRQVTREECLEV